jgi:hypothetical protein
MRRIKKLHVLWAELNAAHFAGTLQAVPIRITRSRRTYGYFNGPDNGGRPSIRISTVLADTEQLLRETMLHEMIHQRLHANGYPYWEVHGPGFQKEHVRVFGHEYSEP